MYRKIKRERPTFKTAHDWFKLGYFSVGEEHHLSKEQYQQELERICEDIRTVAMQQFPRTTNLEYAILKGHLVIEHAITQYIRCFSRVFVGENAIKFSFSQKMEIAYLMGFGANDPVLLPTIERINKIRNQVAHSFAIDRDLLDEALRLHSDEYFEFSIETDMQRIRMLRGICRYICGRVSGEVWADHIVFDGG